MYTKINHIETGEWCFPKQLKQMLKFKQKGKIEFLCNQTKQNVQTINIYPMSHPSRAKGLISTHTYIRYILKI